ncbi:MAG: 50S ribosomal protein L18 [Waddliaceae bacterium]
MKTIERKKQILRNKRTLRVRKHLRGNSAKPRLCVVKSNTHIEAQIIDDEEGKTLASTSTRTKEFRKTECNKKNKKSARKIGEKIAELALKKNIQEVIFDRGSHKYHGILAELADAARGTGLKF